jgi:hypothetical protein
MPCCFLCPLQKVRELFHRVLPYAVQLRHITPTINSHTSHFALGQPASCVQAKGAWHVACGLMQGHEEAAPQDRANTCMDGMIHTLGVIPAATCPVRPHNPTPTPRPTLSTQRLLHTRFMPSAFIHCNSISCIVWSALSCHNTSFITFIHSLSFPELPAAGSRPMLVAHITSAWRLS